MPVPRDIRPSVPRFGDSWARCSYRANLPDGDFELQLRAVVTRLFTSGPDRADPDDDIKSCAINSDYQLVYAWMPDRDEPGNPIFDHLALLVVEPS